MQTYHCYDSVFRTLTRLGWLLLFGFCAGVWMAHPSTANAQVPTQGLVLYYPFNGNVLDQSGSGNNGTPVNVGFTADRNGTANGACLLNGTNSYVAYPDSVFGPTTPGFTFSIWLKGNAVQNGGTAIYKGSVNGEAGLGFSGTNYSFGVKLADGTAPTITTSGTAGIWTHVACVYARGARLELWVNGQLQTSAVPANEDM